MLAERGVCFHWLTLEYDRQFFDAVLAPELLARSDAILRYADEGSIARGPTGDGLARVEAVCWNRTELRPFLPEHAADRDADLDDYVRYPASTGGRFDVMIVDGRKRRRCLMAAADLMGPDTVVLLHDAWHPHYHCALGRYAASRFLGDELWIGAQSAARLDQIVEGREDHP